jgi:hypothetical protein
MGGEEDVSGYGTTLPAAHLFPLPLPVPRTIPQANAVSERNPLLARARRNKKPVLIAALSRDL